MINLMPPAQKQSIAYARRNTTIVKWLASISLALVGIAIITGGSLFYLRQDSSSLKSNIEQIQTDLKDQDETKTLARAQEIGGNIKLAVDVLSNEVLFSELLKSIGSVMPPGAVLQTLSLTSNIASSGITLEVSTVDYETGSLVHANFNDPANGIFEKADIEDITCSTNTEEDSDYPCTVSLRALFAKDNPFLLIGSEAP